MEALFTTHDPNLFIWVIDGLDFGKFWDDKYFSHEFFPYNTSEDAAFLLRATFNFRSLPYISFLKWVVPSLSTQAVQ